MVDGRREGVVKGAQFLIPLLLSLPTELQFENGSGPSECPTAHRFISSSRNYR
jgi:hypothetical protein